MKTSCSTCKETLPKVEYCNQLIININAKFKIGQPVMVKNHACHIFESMYLMAYKVLKILNVSTFLLMTPNGKERKTNINDVKLCSTTELVENAWDSFLHAVKSKCQNYSSIITFCC